MIIQTSGMGTVEAIAAQSKLKDIFAARDEIAKAQMAFKVYEAFGNKTQMEVVHAQAEEARQKLASLGVAKVHYEAGKDLSVYFKQPAVKACEYDPSIRAESVPLIHNEEYLLLLRLAMEKSAAGAYARSQLEAKRLEIEAAERQLALDNQASAKKYNFDEYSKTLIGNTWVLSKNGKTDREAAQASMAYNEAIKNGEIKSNLDNVPVDIMLEQILAAKDGRNYWTGEEISKLQAYGIIFSSLVTTFQWIEGVRGNVKIKRSLSLHPDASEISASKVKKLKVPLSEGVGKLTIPQGLTAEQFSSASSTIRQKVGSISDDILVQGSRTNGTARVDSDIDFAVRVSPEKFDELISQRFGSPNPGSAKEKTMLHAIETGKIQAGEAGLRSLRQQLQQELGIDVDISIIKSGGAFDNGPYIPLK
jgi:hypothetical protein